MKLMGAAMLRGILDCGSRDNSVHNSLYAFLTFCTGQQKKAAEREAPSFIKHVTCSPGRIRAWTWHPLKNATECLSCSYPTLNTAPRQECVALTASYFRFNLDWKKVYGFCIFWRSEADPSKACVLLHLLQALPCFESRVCTFCPWHVAGGLKH